eukprot:2681698-Amphidinium_carterae.3
MTYVWLCSCSSRERVPGCDRRASYAELNQKSWATLLQVRQEGPAQQEIPPDTAFACIALAPAGVYSAALPLTDAELVQVAFWQEAYGMDTSELYCYSVVSVYPLVHTAHLQLPNQEKHGRSFFRAPVASLRQGHKVLVEQHGEGIELTEVQYTARLSLYLPTGFVQHFLDKSWKMLLVPSEPLHGSVRTGRLRMGWTHLQRQFGWNRDSFKDGAAPYLSNELSGLRSAQFNASMAPDLASMMSSVLQEAGNHLSDDIKGRLLAYTECMRNTTLDMHPRFSKSATGLERIESLIQALMIAEDLSADGNLRSTLVAVCRYLMPHDVAQRYTATLQDPTTKVPSKFVLSRARCTIDVAYMLHWRRINSEDGDAVRYVTVDSSPQYHRDYLAVLVKHIPSTALEQ